MIERYQAISAPARGVIFNAVAGVSAGVSLFAFLVVARLALDPEEFVALGQLLVVWPISHAFVAFPVQQLRARSDPAALRAGAYLCGSLTAVLVPVFGIWGEEITRSSDLRIHLIAMVLPTGALATALGRGLAAAQGREALLATLVAGENLLRLSAGLILWAVGAGPLLFGTALVAGFGLNALALFGTSKPEPEASIVGSALHQMIAMTAVGTVGYAVLFLAPGSLALGSSSDRVVAALLFAMAAYRAPYQIVQSMVPKLASEFAAGRWMAGRPLPILASGPVLGLLAAGAGAVFGPWFLDALVGDGDVLSRTDHALAAALTTMGTLNVIGAVALVTRGKLWATTITWMAPALVLSVPVVRANEPTPLLAALVVFSIVVFLTQTWTWTTVDGEQLPDEL